MTQTGGLAVLFAWLIFTALLLILAVFVLRPTRGPDEEAERKPDDPPAVL